MSAAVTPSARALSRSMSTVICGLAIRRSDVTSWSPGTASFGFDLRSPLVERLQIRVLQRELIQALAEIRQYGSTAGSG